MLKVTEVISNGISIYKIEDTFNPSKNRVVKYTTNVVTKDEVSYYILYDSKMSINMDVYKYLAAKRFSYSKSSLYLILFNLKLLFIYSDIIEKPINDFDDLDILSFSYFLSGVSVSNGNIKFKLVKKRQSDRINKIMECCRFFCKWKNYKNYKLFTVSKRVKSAVNRYQDRLPKYASIEEFKAIIIQIRSNEDYSLEKKIKLECIVRLMYESGLRIGEVLGLTLEDVINQSDNYILIVRNRFTDAPCQYAKTCMKIQSRNFYYSNEYHTQNVGFQIAFCKRSLFMLIQRYIDLAHLDKCKLKTYDRSIADCVDGNPNIKENHYLFLNNNNGGAYQRHTFYKDLKEIYEKSNLDFDYHNINNIAHRYRHGFIMNLLYVQKMQPELVIKFSRHTSVKGLEPYNRPTLEDLQEHYNKLEELIEGKSYETD